MSAYPLLSMVLPAALASCASAVGLALSSVAPARWRLAIASSGLLAWVIPWPLIVLPMLAPQAAVTAGYMANASEGYDPPSDIVSSLPTTNTTSTSLLLALLALVALAGLTMLAVDVVRYQRTLARWRRDSASGEHLRTLLPPAIRTVPWAIRIVPSSRTAAATGLGRGTIWIGEDLTAHPHLKAALLHECLHVQRRDAIAIALVSIIRRLYFWNPVVRYFAGRTRLFIEAACDEECADCWDASTTARASPG
jgi:beta-lactamase regulating signal transducer with metallopeptidase domain